MIDDRLSIGITHADGRVTRWGPDAPDGKNIPNDLTFSDSIPGGHATLSTSLLRRIDVPHPDEGLFDDVHCYGPGGRTAWRGRMQQFPRTHGDAYGVSPGAVGWSAHLRDDPSFREIYVDRDTTQWHEPTLDRKVALLASISMGDFSWQSSEGGVTAALPNQALGAQTIAELWYTMPPGLTASTLGYTGTSNGTLTSWLERFRATDTAIATSAEDYAWTLNGALQGATLSTARRYLLAQIYSNGTATTPTAGTSRRLSALVVFGNHDVPFATVTGDFNGVTAGEVVADIVRRSAPLLDPSGIEATTFVIPHLVYRDPVTPEFAISDVNKYHLYDWGVYDNREFFFRAPDPDRLLWEARLSDGAHLDADGDTAEQVINGVFVTYTDPTGVTKTVGPPGGSFDDTDTLLADTSSSNPVNAHGIPRKWVQLNLSFPTTLSGATQIGYVYLQERSLAGRRGRVTLTGTATHPTEAKVPCWRVRAGDWISLKDLNGATIPRKIISKSYSHGSKQVVLDLDNTPAAMDAILARVGIQAGIATGGGF